MDLQKIFVETLSQYSQNEKRVVDCWNEIEKLYSQKKRHYHNLTHLQALLNLLQQYKSIIADWNTLIFSIFYHDAVYNVLKKDNEEKSAELAAKRLTECGVPVAMVAKCQQQILSTKAHGVSEDDDSNLFTDADLSILGVSQPDYAVYCSQIRKEYAYFPDLLYKPGRRKVLDHFLAMPRIYKTAQFYNTFESQARQNLEWELTCL